ncbi:hypothetical protein JAAARDRAFT_74766 [Jaapia argillacea MUCL 33604]|uniref:Uncharacterized protein n=1 Tax=Jaapia argillacea MUCL 33604 TaxID=933084 RepID=A0A067PDX9_9AGAM|nr:hypothetical protein JAAARDRAFT_74766 [Jaapia argillacea MUCL 33604]
MSQNLSSWWQPSTPYYLLEQPTVTSTRVPISTPAMINDRAPYSITLAPDGLSVDEVLQRLGCSPGWEMPDFGFITDWRQSPSPVPGVPTSDPRLAQSGTGRNDIQNSRMDVNTRTIRPTEQLLDEHSAMARPKHKVRKTVENDQFRPPGAPRIGSSTMLSPSGQPSRMKRQTNTARTRRNVKNESTETQTGTRKAASTGGAGHPPNSEDPKNTKLPSYQPANGASSQIIAVQETPTAVFPPFSVSRGSGKTPGDPMDMMGSPSSLPSLKRLGKRKRDEEVDEESKECKEKRKREEINEYARSYLPETFCEVQRTPNLLLGCVHEMRRLGKKEQQLEDRNVLLEGKIGRMREVLQTPADAEKGERNEEMRAHLLYIIDSPFVTE